MKNVQIYSTPTCHFCHMAKEYFKEHNIAFTDHNVSTDLEKRKEMIDRTHQMGVPVIDIDGEIIIGYNEPVLAKALGIA